MKPEKTYIHQLVPNQTDLEQASSLQPASHQAAGAPAANQQQASQTPNSQTWKKTIFCLQLGFEQKYIYLKKKILKNFPKKNPINKKTKN